MKRSLAKNPSNIIMVIATIMTLILLATTIKVYAAQNKHVDKVEATSGDLQHPTNTPQDTEVWIEDAGDGIYDINGLQVYNDGDPFNSIVDTNTRFFLDGKETTCKGVSPTMGEGYIRYEVGSSSSSSSTSSSSSSSKKKDDGKKSDKKKDSGSDDTASWILNPNEMNIGYFIPAAAFPGTYRMGKQEQGPVAKTVFASATPAGWKEAFTFNLTKDGKADASVKSGQMKVTIPSQFIKAGRQFAILALDKSGNIHTYPDTDASDGTVSANINFEGYAFSLVYKD